MASANEIANAGLAESPEATVSQSEAAEEGLSANIPSGQAEENAGSPDETVPKIPPAQEKTEISATVTVPDNEQKAQGGIQSWMIGGAVAGALIFLAVLVAIHLIRKKRKNVMDQDAVTYEPGLKEGAGMAAKVLLDDPAAPVKIGCVHDPGRRSMQQDSFGICDTEDISRLRKKGVMAVVADGMGGLSDGERMSQMVVVKMLQGFDESADDAIPSSTLLGLVGEANDAVNNELGSERIGKCGSTVVAVILKDRKLSWISVGDSHIYVYRQGQLHQINTDHNYGTQLDRMVERGEISFEEASTDPQRAALTSYIGIGDLELIDQNETPIAMEAGDRILLMSDGVYGTVDERAITEMMALPFRKTLLALDRAVSAREKSNQDNYTCVMLEVI